MPLYYYRCCKCHRPCRKIQTPEEAAKLQSCECGYTLRREPKPPSTQVKETLDNGVMTKRLERLADAERLFAERAEVTDKKRRGE
jgi:hypothetical protein